VRRAGVLSALMLGVGMAVASEEVLILPSGLMATPYEMLSNRAGNELINRYRFVAPEFTVEGQDFDQMMMDLEYLCTEYALAHLAKTGPVPKQVIISLADGKSVFGAIDPDVTQVFETYRVEDGTCIWEMF